MNHTNKITIRTPITVRIRFISFFFYIIRVIFFLLLIGTKRTYKSKKFVVEVFQNKFIDFNSNILFSKHSLKVLMFNGS